MEGGLAEVDIEISRARSSRAVRAALVDFEVVFQDAIYWSRAASAYKRIARLARQSLRVAESRYQSGRGQYLSVLFAENRVDLLNAQHKSALERATAARGQLAALLEIPAGGLDHIELSPADDPTLPDRESLREDVSSRGPGVQEAEATTERARLMVRYVERQVLPELTPGTSLTRTGDVPKRSADLMYSTRAPFLAELSLVTDAAEASLESAYRVIPADADVLWAALSESLRDLALASGAQKRRAKQARESAADAFNAGTLSFFELDATLTRVLEIDLSIHRYRKVAAIAAAKLAAISGAP